MAHQALPPGLNQWVSVSSHHIYLKDDLNYVDISTSLKLFRQFFINFFISDYFAPEWMWYYLLRLGKAFDSVPHRHLLVKLQAHGIKGKLLNWI